MLSVLTTCSCFLTIRSPTASHVKRLLSRLISKYQHVDEADKDEAGENPQFHGDGHVEAWPVPAPEVGAKVL